MKTLLINLLFYLLPLTICAQNPILLAEEHTDDSDGWYWTASTERTYDKADRLICQNIRKRDSGSAIRRINDICFDEAGNQIETSEGYIGRFDEGQYIWKTVSKFNKDGRQIRFEALEKEATSDIFQFQYGSYAEFMDDEIVLFKFLDENGNINVETGYSIAVYDEKNMRVGQASTRNINLDYQILKNRFRVTERDLENGNKQIVYEKLRCAHFDTCRTFCPELLDTCTVWNIVSNKVYDNLGRLVLDGPIPSGSKSLKLLTYKYEPNKVSDIYEIFRIRSSQNDTILTFRIETIKDKQENLLYQKRNYSTSFEIINNHYNEDNLIIRSDITKAEENWGIIDTSTNSIYYDYEFYCDGLVKERLARRDTLNTYFKKLTYNYKYPPVNCPDELIPTPIIQLFPNPANQFFKLSSDLFKDYAVDILVMNNIGQKIIMQKNIRHNNQEIDISSLSNGIYFVSIFAGKQVFSKKLIIQRR